jgi:hypothetical protein
MTVGRTPWTGDPALSQGRTYTGETRSDTHASSGIRTHDPNVPAGEDILYLSPRGHCDRLQRRKKRKPQSV